MENINDMLSSKEAEVFPEKEPAVFNIVVQNKLSNAKNSMPVLPANTLGQVMYACRELIGIDPTSKTVTFENGETHKSTTEQGMAVKDFGLKEGSLLILCDEGKVAAL